MRFYKLILMAVLAVVLIGCSTEQTKPLGDTSGLSYDPVEAEKEIRANLLDFFKRIREGDKTVMFEQEFDYYHVNWTLDDYYGFAQVSQYVYDTLKGIDIDSVRLFEDSAKVYIKIVYESDLGGETRMPYAPTMYRSGDRWHKPSMSNTKEEWEFREVYRDYEVPDDEETE